MSSNNNNNYDSTESNDGNNEQSAALTSTTAKHSSSSNSDKHLEYIPIIAYCLIGIVIILTILLLIWFYRCVCSEKGGNNEQRAVDILEPNVSKAVRNHQIPDDKIDANNDDIVNDKQRKDRNEENLSDGESMYDNTSQKVDNLVTGDEGVNINGKRIGASVAGNKTNNYSKKNDVELEMASVEMEMNCDYWEWSEKDVLKWVKINLLEKGIESSKIESFLTEFECHSITGKILKQFKQTPQLISTLKSHFSKENQRFGVWLALESAISQIDQRNIFVD